MRYAIDAHDLVALTAARIDLSRDAIEEIFRGAPLDFPVRFGRHLPLYSDRFGMIGITLGGRVWLLERTRELNPAALIALVRHEAEHVRQQREHPVGFYARYGLEWIGGLFSRPAGVPETLSRLSAAYLGIGYEREAYAAGEHARRVVEREIRRRRPTPDA